MREEMVSSLPSLCVCVLVCAPAFVCVHLQITPLITTVPPLTAKGTICSLLFSPTASPLYSNHYIEASEETSRPNDKADD